MTRTEIAPGATVTTLPGEKFKRCKIAVHLVLQSNRSTATALALLPHVLERRCQAIPDPTALSRRLFELYGASLSSESYTVGANRVVSLSISGLRNEFALAGEDLAGEYLELLCQLLFRPKLANGVFEAEDVEIEKGKQADYLRSEMNDKRVYCLRQARRKLFGTSPLGIEGGGYLEDMPGLTPASLYEAYGDLLRRAEIEVMVCGADGEAAGEKLRGYLAGLQRAPEKAAPTQAAQPPAVYQEYKEAMDTAQGKLAILFTSGKIQDARGDAVVRVASALLGGLPTSRLFVNVREKQSLCYYCSAGYVGFTGVLTVDSGVDHKNAEKAEKAIMHEMEALQTAPVTEEELGFAHNALANAFSTAKDSPDALMSWRFFERLRGTNLSLDDISALVRQVTAADVQAALASFTPALTYLITGKEAAQ